MISQRLRRDKQVSIQTRRPPQHPALEKFLQERGKSFENRIADTITRFAGSMTFIYIHLVWFTSWIVLGVEDYPYGLLTMIVSLEAIFLSTFVMISQNRAEAKRQVIADQEWETVRLEQRQNEDLLALSQQILELTRQVHTIAVQSAPSSNTDGSNS
jgi:uncharacterized membrane protein